MADFGAPRHEGERFRVAAYDFGIKQNILRMLVDHHCEVTGGSRADFGGRRAGAWTGWRISFEWPGRSGADRLRG